MNIVVVGANGRVGRHIVERALAHGHRVTAAVRNPASMRVQHERLLRVSCDVRDPIAVAAAMSGQEAVLCAVGAGSGDPTMLYSTAAENVLQGMQAHRVGRLVFLSNFGVLNEAATDWRSSALLFLAKRTIRQTLADHHRALDLMCRCDLRWTAVRPMVLTDGPPLGRYRVAIDGLPAKGWRIARADVAEFMLKQVQDDRYLYKAPAIAY